MISKITYISLNTLIEAFRDRLVTSLIITGILLIGSAELLAELSFVERRKIVMDVGFTAMYAIGVLLAIFASTNLLVREVDTKRILCVFAKPVRRAHFVIGKYLGICWALAAITLLLSVVLLIFVRYQTGLWEPAIFIYTYLLFFELMLLSALALFFSSFTTQFLGILYSTMILFAGHMIGDLRVYSASTKFGSQMFSRLVTFFFPNLQVFNLQRAIVHDIQVDASYLLLSTAYSLSFVVVLVIAAIAIFINRDFNK